MYDRKGEQELLRLARSLPTTGEVLCSPPLWLAPDAATDPSKHRPVSGKLSFTMQA
eukprot:COSAG05_NODE_390_length_10436_cov_15.721196_11_plen_56_part_00